MRILYSEDIDRVLRLLRSNKSDKIVQINQIILYKVTLLSIFNNNIGDQGAKDLSLALQGTNVTSLDLTGNKIGAQGAKDLALQGTNVTSLNLSWNNIGDQGAKDLSLALQGTNVTSLNLKENNIGDQGAKDLGQALQDTNVTSLNLRGNNMGAQAFGYIMDQITENRNRVANERRATLTLLRQHRKNRLSGIAPVVNRPATQILNIVFSLFMDIVSEYLFKYSSYVKRLEREKREKEVEYAGGILAHPDLPAEIFDEIMSHIPSLQIPARKTTFISRLRQINQKKDGLKRPRIEEEASQDQHPSKKARHD